MKKIEKSERELLEEINRKLEDLVSLIAIQGKDTDTQIKILIKRKYKPREIASFIGLTPNAVRLRKFKKLRGSA